MFPSCGRGLATVLSQKAPRSSTRRWDVRSLLSVMVAGALLSGTVFVSHAEAGDKKRGHGRADVGYERYDRGYYRDDRDYRDDRYYRHDRYYRGHDVVVIRDYYRPYYRPLPPGLQKRYYRGGYLPPGWAKRVYAVPVYVEREMVVVPHGYHRGIIDGHAVVYNDRGFILDVAVLF
jgi:hypothetical protein